MELYEYTQEQEDEVLNEARKVLKSYRDLKGRVRRMFPHVKSPTFSDMPRGGQSEPDKRLFMYLEVSTAVDNIEKCVAMCDLRESILIQKKYLDSKSYQYWELVQMSGYGDTQYKYYMRRALFQFAEAFGIYPKSLKTDILTT